MKNSSKKDEETKDRLIQAAGEVFARDGFRSATVREICSRAGTHVGAVNYHFRDKEGLYAAVLYYSHESMVKKYPPDSGLRDGATPAEKLRAFIHSFLLRIFDEGVPAWHGKLMARETVESTNAFGHMIQNSIQPLYRYLVRILIELLNEDQPSEAEESNEIFLCAMSIVGQCLHHFTGRRVIAALHPKSFDPADIVRIADHITRFSLLGIQEFRSKKLHPIKGTRGRNREKVHRKKSKMA